MTAARDPDVLQVAARAAAAKGRPSDAIVLLREAADGEPGFAPVQAELAQLLQRAGKAEEALLLVETRIREFPERAWPLSIKAALLDVERRTAEALPVHEQLVRRIPHIHVAWMNYGHALRAIGRTDEAIAAYREAIALEPWEGSAWWALASVATVALGRQDAEQMERVLERADEVRKVPLHFALGRALEAAGDFEQSFRHYDMGNWLRTKLVAPASANVDALVSRSIDLLSAHLDPQASQAPSAERPVFIVGMPRSGSTLVEQMLATHPQVEALGELPHLQDLAREIGGVGAIAGLSSADLQDLGNRYLASVRRYRRTSRLYFTDKLPANWQWIGLIRLMLPNAKIIDVRREPMACCFANFAFYFNRQTNLAAGLQDLARYYCAYTRLVDHFAAGHPGQLRTISYEWLVNDPEATARSMLAFVGLAFDPHCVHPSGDDHVIHTPSAEQVRQPIHGAANERWRSFEPWLSPLGAALARN